jgi:hypothetical protein
MYSPINTPQGGSVDIASFSAMKKYESVPGQLPIMVYLGAAI